MCTLDAKDFVSELMRAPERLVKISQMPEEERRGAIRALGYGFTSRELDDYICYYADMLRDDLYLGEGDFRDIIMDKIRGPVRSAGLFVCPAASEKFPPRAVYAG